MIQLNSIRSLCSEFPPPLMRVVITVLIIVVSSPFVLLCDDRGDRFEPKQKMALEWTPGTHPPLPLKEMDDIFSDLLSTTAQNEAAIKLRVLHGRSQVRFWLSDGPGYLTDVRNAISLAPKDPDLRLLYGLRFVYAQEEKQLCLEEANRLIREAPDSFHGYYLAGRIDLTALSGQDEESERCVQLMTRAIARQPDYSAAYLSRSASYFRLKRSNESLLDAEKVLQLPPISDRISQGAEFIKGVSLVALDRHAEAIPYLEKSLGADQDDATIMYALWYSYESQGRLGTCHWTAERFAKNHPDDYRAQALLALSLLSANRNKDAYEHAKIAVKIGEKSGMTWSAFGTSQTALGEYAAAIDSFRKAVRIDPSDRNASICLAYLLATSDGDDPQFSVEAKKLLDLAISGGMILDQSRVLIIQSCVAASAGDFRRAERLASSVADAADQHSQAEVTKYAEHLRASFKAQKRIRIADGKMTPKFTVVVAQPVLIGPRR